MATNVDSIEALIRDAALRGCVVELGWLTLRKASVPANAPQIQLDEMRNAFFAGAQHLFSSIMTVLDPGVEPTDADVKRMEMVKSELDEFLRQYKEKHGI